MRGIVEPPKGLATRGVSLRRPVAGVIVPSARIVRASQGGQTILAVADADLTRLQAAWAASVPGGVAGRRSTLLAVAPPRSESQSTGPQDFAKPRSQFVGNLVSRSTAQPSSSEQPGNPSPAIPSFDPLGQMKSMEVIVAGKRDRYIFAGDDASDSSASGLPSYSFGSQ